MLKDIDNAVKNPSPRGHGYYKSRWDTRALQRYIAATCGKKYSTGWIRQILPGLGYTFKRGTKRPTKASKEAQEAFRQNDRLVGRTCA